MFEYTLIRDMENGEEEKRVYKIKEFEYYTNDRGQKFVIMKYRSGQTMTLLLDLFNQIDIRII